MNTATGELPPTIEPVKFSPSDLARFWAKVNKNGPLPDQSNPHYAGLGPCWVWIGAKFSWGYGMFYKRKVQLRAHRIAWEIANEFVPSGKWVLHKCDNPACVRLDHLFLGDIIDNNDDRIAKGRSASGLAHGRYTKPDRTARGASNGSVTKPESLSRGDNHYSRVHPEKLARGDRSGSKLHPERLSRGDDHWSRKNPEKVPRGETHGLHLHPESVVRGTSHPLAKLTDEDVRSIRDEYASGGVSQRALASKYFVNQALVSRIILRKSWPHIV